MGRRRKPIIWGLDNAVGYQRAVHNLLIAMGFVPLPILRLLFPERLRQSVVTISLWRNRH